MSRSLLVALSLATCLAWPVLAGAESRIVLLDFNGPEAEAIRLEVAEVLGEQYTIVPTRRFARALRQAGAPGAGRKAVARAAAKLKVDAIIAGRVRQRGTRYRVVLTLRAGRDGRVVQTSDFMLARPRLNKAARRRLAEDLQTAIDELSGSGAVEEPERPARTGRRRPGNRRESDGVDEIIEDSERGRRSRRDRETARSLDEDETPPGLGGEEAEDEADDEGGDRGGDREEAVEEDEDDAAGDAADDDGAVEARRPGPTGGLDITAGLGLSARKLAFNATTGTSTAALDYNGSPVPSAVLGLLVYPLRLAGQRGAASRIGVRAGLDYVLHVKTTVVQQNTGGGQNRVDLPTKAMSYGLGLFYALALGQRPIELRIGAGYQRFRFTIDRSQAPAGVGVPSVDYAYLDPGLELHLPLGPRAALGAGAHYLLILDAGEISQSNLYGDGSKSGFAGSLGGEYALSPRFWLRASAKISVISHSFRGNGALTNQDGNAGTKEIQGASDRNLGFAVGAAYLF